MSSVSDREPEYILFPYRPPAPKSPTALEIEALLSKVVPFPRRLPWDVLLLVFEESDNSTLAVLGRVSLEVLVATTRILYQEIVIHSGTTLEELFCERKDDESRLNPHLSLRQIEDLNVDFIDFGGPSPGELSFARIMETDPLPLQILRYGRPFFYQMDREEQPTVSDLLYQGLFPHLNPEVFFSEVDGRYPVFGPFQTLLASVVLSQWTRMKAIDLKGQIEYSSVGGVLHLVALPLPTRDRVRLLLLHLDTLYEDSGEPFLRWFLQEGRYRDSVGLEGMREGSIVLVVGSEERKKEVEQDVRNLVEDRWRKVFSVSVWVKEPQELEEIEEDEQEQ